MATRSQFAESAKAHDLLVADFNGEVAGIGLRDELESLIASGELPQGTKLREAAPSDF